jgi:hypothetical protein
VLLILFLFCYQETFNQETTHITAFAAPFDAKADDLNKELVSAFDKAMGHARGKQSYTNVVNFSCCPLMNRTSYYNISGRNVTYLFTSLFS